MTRLQAIAQVAINATRYGITNRQVTCIAVRASIYGLGALGARDSIPLLRSMSSPLTLQVSPPGTKDSCMLVSLILVIYDHVLTFDDEINEIWTFRTSLVGALVLLVRYFTLFSRALGVFAYFYMGWTPTICSVMDNIEYPGLTSTITIVLVHMIMILRVFALYGAHVPILVFLGLLLVGEALVLITPLFIRNASDQPLPGCLGLSSSKTSSFYWASPVVQDTVMFLLTIKKSRQYTNSTNGTSITLLKVFLRDGFLYYVVLGMTHCLNSLLLFRAPEFLKTSASSFIQVLTTVLISRLVFNLRKQASLRPEHDPSTGDVLTSQFFVPVATKSTFNLTTAGSLASMCAFFNIDRELTPPELPTIHAPHPCLSNVELPVPAHTMEEMERFDDGKSSEIGVNGPHYE